MRYFTFFLLIFYSYIENISACNVPVFRYALERWDPDLFTIIIRVNELKTSIEQKNFAFIQAHSYKQSNGPNDSNINFNTFSNYQIIIEKEIKEKSHFIIFSPQNKRDTIYKGFLDDENVQDVITSPIRENIINYLTEENGIAWVFVKSGIKVKDQKALKIIRKGLDSSYKCIHLPSLTTYDINEYFGGVKPDFSIKFQNIVVDKNDIKEKIFINLLIASEPLLKNVKNEPLLFPIFGKGRVLYALAGRGITIEHIIEANQFLYGPCACTVKEQNPGKDLLFTADWSNLIKKKFVKNNKLNKLPGLGNFIN